MPHRTVHFPYSCYGSESTEDVVSISGVCHISSLAEHVPASWGLFSMGSVGHSHALIRNMFPIYAYHFSHLQISMENPPVNEINHQLKV